MQGNDNMDTSQWPQRHGTCKPNPAGLLDLPVEIRKEIYSHLLPFAGASRYAGTQLGEQENGIDAGNWVHPSGRSLNGHKSLYRLVATTAFMRTCRQIHEEAADYLYSHGRIELHFYGASMFGQKFNWNGVVAPYFAALQHLKYLDVNICPHISHYATCELQAQVSRLSRWLASPNNIHSVRIYIRHNLEASDWKEELCNLESGDLSSQHIAAFLLAPFRDIRLPESASISIHYQSFKLAAFRHVPSLLENDILSKNTRGFRNNVGRYVSAALDLCNLLRSIYTSFTWHHPWHYAEILWYPCIMGDTELIFARHQTVISKILAGVKDPTLLGMPAYQTITDEQCADLGRTITAIAMSLPRTTDVPGFGVGCIDGAIKAWLVRHKEKSVARRQKARRQERGPGAAKHVKLDEAVAEGDDDSSVYDEHYYNGNHGYEHGFFTDDEGEDSDGVAW